MGADTAPNRILIGYLIDVTGTKDGVKVTFYKQYWTDVEHRYGYDYTSAPYKVSHLRWLIFLYVHGKKFPIIYEDNNTKQDFL